MLLFIFCLSTDISGLYSKFIPSSVALGDQTAWISLEYDRGRPADQLYLYQHEERNLRVIVHPAMKVSGRSRLFVSDGGFGLIDGESRKIFFFSMRGELIDYFSLIDIDGFNDTILISEVVSKEPMSLLVSYRDTLNPENMYFGSLNLWERKFILLHSESKENTGFWLPAEKGGWVFFNKETSQVSLLDKNFKRQSILYKGKEPIVGSKIPAKYLKVLRNAGRSPNRMLIKGNYHKGGNWIFFKHFKQEGKEHLFHQFRFDTRLELVRNSRLHLIQAEDHDVIYSLSEGTYSVNEK